MPKFRKKPVIIEAVQLRRDNLAKICEFVDVGKLEDGKPEYRIITNANVGHEGMDRLELQIPTLEGVMVGVENDWIIKGIQGELYPCKPDIFDATYEPVDGDTK